MNTAFHRCCASALTNPATVAALAVLLINDLVLKAIWSNPWTTGKLSDLAWVIFASPLLAFILSLFTRRSQLAQRAAFIIAYIGLPALYAAFNTFEPLHDLIIQGLLMLSGASIGSPFDPTDSLVIPFGMAMALWVWRRSNASKASLRMRLALLMAGAASFATIATPSPVMSDRLVGHLDEGTLVLNLDFATYMSSDGGLSWRESPTYIDTSTVEWGGSTVQTPKGKYTTDGLEIIRSHGSERETVYSPSYLRRDADVRFQEHLDRRKFEACPYSCPSSSLLNIVYDARSGNIVAATGAQGVVVGDSNGNWRQVAVGWHEPTDFSLRNKLNVLLDEMTFWMASAALSIWGVAFALWILHSSSKRQEPYTSRLPHTSQISESRSLSGSAVNKQMSMRTAETNWGALIGMGCLIISAIALVFGLSQMLTGSTSIGVGADLNDPIATVSLVSGCLFGIIAFISCRPSSGRHLLIVLVAFLSMIALFILAFVIGVMQGFNLTAAKFYAVILIVLAAFTLAFLLNGEQFLPKRKADRQD